MLTSELSRSDLEKKTASCKVIVGRINSPDHTIKEDAMTIATEELIIDMVFATVDDATGTCD